MPEFSNRIITTHRFHIENAQGDTGIGYDMIIVNNTEKPLRYHRGDSVVVFQYYQQKYVTLRSS